MNLVQFFKPGLIILNSALRSKEEAIQQLVGKILEEYPHLESKFIMQKIQERENLSKTTYPNGIAIPHARIDNLNDLIISALIPRAPIKEDDIEIRIIFLILTDSAKSNLYLNVISSISGLCREEENINRLVASGSPDDFIKNVSVHAVPIKQVIHAKDIMTTPPFYLFPHSTVKESLDLMSKHHVGYVPICDTRQKLLGEVNICDILKIGLPPYAQMLKNIKFLSTIEPLEDLLKNEEKILLSSIMQKPSIIISPNAYIIEVIFQFIKNTHRKYFPVVENDICVGVITYMDIVNKFLRV